MQRLVITVCLALLAAGPAEATEFLGVKLCKGSVDTSVVLPVGSPLSLESAEIGRHGGLLMLLKADNGDVMDHIDNLMAFYTDSRGTGDAKKLQWAGNDLTAYAQLIKKGFAALAVSTEDDCLGADAATIIGEDEAEPVAVIAAPEPEPTSIVAGTVPPPVPVPAPTPVEDFVLSGRLKHSPAEDMWVDVMGVVINNSGSSYHIANFDLSFYDADGNLICVDAISVSELRTGQERAFRDSVRCADYMASSVVSWKIQFAGGR